MSDRLQGLDKLMSEAEKKVQDQSELCTAFQQNQIRASNLGDASILPDLCESHSSQLSVMLKNHLDIRDILRRIWNAKEELGINLILRLKYIMHIENSMSELDNQLLFYHRCLRRMQRHLIIIEQIHTAPSIYVTAVTEVVRRRTFSGAFLEVLFYLANFMYIIYIILILLQWASDLAHELLSIHDEEIMRRQEFVNLFEGHFLNTLFTGMDDMPPPFAINAPAPFDSSLPNISKNGIF